MIQNLGQPTITYDKEKGIKYANGVPFLEEKDIEYLKEMIPKVEKLAQECLELKKNEELEIHELKNKVTELQKKMAEIDEDQKQDMIVIKDNQQKLNEFLRESKDEMIKTCKNIDEERENHYSSRQIKIQEDYIKITSLLKESDDKNQFVRKQINNVRSSLRNKNLLRQIGIGIIIHFGSLLIFHALSWAKNETGKVFLIALKAINLTKFQPQDSEI